MAYAKMHSNDTIAVSLWGQQKEKYLLWTKDMWANAVKIGRARKSIGKTNLVGQPLPNYMEWETPAFTWTEKFAGGNFRGILGANEKNLKEFSAAVGKVDLIHAQICHKAGLIAYHLSEKYHIPYIITEQMSPFPFPQILTRAGILAPKYAAAYHHAHANVAISPDLMQKMNGLGIPKVKVIPNLVDEDFFIPASDRPQMPFTFFTLCDMREQKNLPILFKAITKVVAQFPETKFRIGGGGEMFSKWKQLSESMGLSPYITWLGPLDRIQALKEFQRAHAFVLPSLHETLGVVFLESIACGVPVIATRCGGPESIVTPENGILIEVNDPDGLFRAMAKLITNYTQYDPTLIRSKFLDKFSILPICSQLRNLYLEAIA